ncbi:uncharacterized protein BKCO1_45000100 [Diplodia corticola]|uniref:L-ascorbic acid binding protein n=1 Tax=Diplodia corticola TaxID=236234 RepID=A0A1J9QUK7_9PEZI|nr:uncharacterized protein BKCO1_45000100 [Diplodia corticola]OJD31658.1 hypothetical protein BKCO1_45000100 [Diplodia corticola]
MKTMSAAAHANSLAKMTTAMQHVYRYPVPDAATVNSTAAAPSKPWTPPPATAGHRGRYLWTDAFGVLNFLTLHRASRRPDSSSSGGGGGGGECKNETATYLTYATALAQAVHDVLGRTRDGSARLPGATDADPMGGGLRIGKEDAGGPDGDGQYHHYLTLWMYALNRLAVAWRGEGREAEAGRWNGHAVRLMQAVHPAFVYDRAGGARPRMYWKVSVDLKRPLVLSEGNLDPVDGLVVCKLLAEFEGGGEEVLAEERRDYEKIVATKWANYTSSDPLDLGMTLWTAHQYAGKEQWATGFVDRAKRDLKVLIDSDYFKAGLRRRLAFREFGTALGIRCALFDEDGWGAEAERVIGAWEDAGIVPEPTGEAMGNANASTDLAPITLVMYAAALEPGGNSMSSPYFAVEADHLQLSSEVGWSTSSRSGGRLMAPPEICVMPSGLRCRTMWKHGFDAAQAVLMIRMSVGDLQSDRVIISAPSESTDRPSYEIRSCLAGRNGNRVD